MAEKKYDLLLGPKRDSNLKIRNQPWYRERLISKYKYDRKPALDTSSWTFIRDGLDDFRDGRPPDPDVSIITKGTKSFLPSALGTGSFDREKTEQRTKKYFTKHEAIYSKAIPNQGKQRKKVEDIENSLLCHPLALYPDIGRSLPPDVFENIVGILDPILALGNTQPFTSDAVEQERSNNSGTKLQGGDMANKILPKSSSIQNHIDKEPISGYRRAIRNVFKNNRVDSNKIEEEPSKEEKPGRVRSGRRKTIQNQLNMATSLSKIDHVTKEFCDWVKDLGGEGNNIEEESIKGLFASSCETTNPVLSAPVRVVELTNIPPDLRSKKTTILSPVIDDMHTQEKTYVPSWNKIKYGAWYLEPKMWRVRPANELLQDPKETEGKKMSQTRQKSKDLDSILSELHGTQSFRQFVSKKDGIRKPEFLELISLSTHEDNEPSNSSRFNKTSTPKVKHNIGVSR